MTTATTTLFDLTGRAARLADEIEAIAAGLLADDADMERIHAELERLITAEESNRDELIAKADAWCWVITRYQQQAAARKAKAEQLKRLASFDEEQAKLLMDRLIKALAVVDPISTKWDFPCNALRSRKSTAVEIDSEVEPEDLPELYQRVVTTVSFNKELITERLKAGETIQGARLVERRSWRLA